MSAKCKSVEVIDRIRSYLREQYIDFENIEHLEDIKARINGKKYALPDHIRGLVHSLLSNQRKWITVIPKLPEIEELFFRFDADAILREPADYFIEGIYSLKCGNISTKKQMEALHNNIRLFYSIMDQYGSLDSFYADYTTNELARLLSDPKSEYKLQCVGFALAWQYLRNMGFDGAKPDVHLRRILGRNRLGYANHPMATENEVISAIEIMSRESSLSCSYINDLLWYYCSDGYGSICNANPKCDICNISRYCGQQVG